MLENNLLEAGKEILTTVQDETSPVDRFIVENEYHPESVII